MPLERLLLFRDTDVTQVGAAADHTSFAKYMHRSTYGGTITTHSARKKNDMIKNKKTSYAAEKEKSSTNMRITKHRCSLAAVSLVIALSSTLAKTAIGFAYAPNFITKIIEQSTGIAPVGLLDVTGGSGGSAVADADADITTSPESSPSFVGPITTRFPPEPNGYLHLGHAKAVSFNFAVARAFSAGKGRCHMRLDDTNPTKEDEEYVKSILEDVRWIQRGCPPFDVDDAVDAVELSEQDRGPWYGPVRKTSDYFSLIYDAAVHLIERGEAFVDELTAEEMREYRGTLTEAGKESPWRNRSIEENLELFRGVSPVAGEFFLYLVSHVHFSKEFSIIIIHPTMYCANHFISHRPRQMRNGDYPEGKYVLRAKIDMSSPNLNMRDPVIYRIKHESHQATGDEWCIYPMYDFSHPIADAAEGVTHSLCTLEFEDHRPLYDWVAERVFNAGLVNRLPRQIEFSRLNLK